MDDEKQSTLTIFLDLNSTNSREITHSKQNHYSQTLPDNHHYQHN